MNQRTIFGAVSERFLPMLGDRWPPIADIQKVLFPGQNITVSAKKLLVYLAGHHFAAPVMLDQTLESGSRSTSDLTQYFLGSDPDFYKMLPF